MKVVLIWNGPANDAERAVLAGREVAFLKELALQNVRATVVLFGDRGGIGPDLRVAGIPVHVLPVPLPPAAAAISKIPAAVLRLRSLLRRLQPDVVEATEAMPAIAAGLAAWPRRVARVVIYRRQHGGGRRRLVLASRFAASLADRTLVSNEPMRRLAAVTDRTEPDRIDVAWPGTPEPRPIAAGDVAAARCALGICAGAFVIGAISRLRREKGLDVLIRALDHLGEGDGVHLVIAGSGPEETQLRELAGASTSPVHFLGNRQDVGLWLHAADVIAIPSRFESFGRLTLQAMAAGRPIVAARVGGLTEAIVDGESGVLVPPDDPPALAEALRAMLNDRARARCYGEAARERFRARYTMPLMAAQRRAAWERSLAAEVAH